jgi:hypothetical protein
VSTQAWLFIVVSGPDDRACIEASTSSTNIVSTNGMISQR